MKVRLKINGIDVTIKDGDVKCNDKLLKQEIESVLLLGDDAPPQDGYYPQLKKYFSTVEFIGIEDKETVY